MLPCLPQLHSSDFAVTLTLKPISVLLPKEHSLQLVTQRMKTSLRFRLWDIVQSEGFEMLARLWQNRNTVVER
jgi:hypothetical protein